jgi:anti-anti-sigma regulatory factor
MSDGDPRTVVVERNADVVRIEGELTGQNVKLLQIAFSRLPADPNLQLTLQLYALDIDDGVALAVVLTSLRELSLRVKKVILVGAPQLLGHNLYRVGMLSSNSRIELREMRLDEAGIS